jgi:hypothetical protein
MIDIRQITNFDLDNANEVTKSIVIGGDYLHPIDYIYKEITSEMLGSNEVFKFGYCTNSNEGMNYPIFLTVNGEETEFQIGKTGMFEITPEIFSGDIEITPKITGVRVPIGEVGAGLRVTNPIKFKLDYMFAIN